tara:strand:+ start:3486 stop:4007 length:522 start_codon:yes stop_codon:yes gene_type:complete
MFEDKIINISQSRYRNLLRPAKIAAAKPDTCVKILNKSAYYVIKDCADITVKYIPHFVYSGIKDPITKLKGNVTENDIDDFVSRALKADHTQQLLRLILDDVLKRHVSVQVNRVSSEAEIDFTLTGEEDDVYGDYEYGTDSVPEVDIDNDTSVKNVNINDVESVLQTLKEALL